MYGLPDTNHIYDNAGTAQQKILGKLISVAFRLFSTPADQPLITVKQVIFKSMR